MFSIKTQLPYNPQNSKGNSSFAVIALHLTSLLLLSIVVFWLNDIGLYVRWDGFRHVIESNIQATWGGSLATINMDFLRANGELMFPNLYRLNPAMVMARWFGDGELIRWMAMSIHNAELFISIVITGRAFGFSLRHSIAAAWAGCVLVMPMLVPPPAYIRLWGNPIFATGILAVMAALCTFVYARKGRILIGVAGLFIPVAFVAVTLPMMLVICVPLLLWFGIATLMWQQDTHDRKAKAIVLAFAFLLFLPLLAFVLELHIFSKVSFFWADMYPSPPNWREASFFLHPSEEAGWTGIVIYGLFLFGAIRQAIGGIPSIKRLAITYLAFESILLLAAGAGQAAGWSWRGPPLGYIEMAALPFQMLFLATSLSPIWRKLSFPTRISGIQNHTILAAVLPWVLILPALAWAPGKGFPAARLWPWPPTKPEPVAFLANEIGLTPGSIFRGRVANISGADFGSYKAPVINQFIFDDGFIMAGNDIRRIGLWFFNIPTLETSGQFTSPFFHAVISRLLNPPHSESTRAHEQVAQFHPTLLAALGVRYVIDSGEQRPGAHEVWSGRMSGRDLRIYELDNPNLGTYTPTKIYQAANIVEALERMNSIGYRPTGEAIVHSAVEGPLITAKSSGLRVLKDGISVDATSEGRSLLVLPVEFSNCLDVVPLNITEKPLTIMRVNINQTGILFERHVAVALRYRFGPLMNSGCRLNDLRDAKTLGMDRVTAWWP